MDYTLISDADRATGRREYLRAVRALVDMVNSMRLEALRPGSTYALAAATVSVEIERDWECDYTSTVAAVALAELARIGYPHHERDGSSA